MNNVQRRKQPSLLGTPHSIKIRSFHVTIARGMFCKELVIAVFRGRLLNATNKFVTNHFRCVSQRHQHHTRSGVPCRMHKRRLNNESFIELRTQRVRNMRGEQKTVHASENSIISSSTCIVRWQGAMCVRHMIRKAHALRLANILILCYGLRSFHRPSVPPSRVVKHELRAPQWSSYQI